MNPYCAVVTPAESFTPSPNSTVESERKARSDGALMQVEENAIDFSWKEVFPDKSDIEERLPSELITLVSLSMASLRLNSFAATTVLGVVADSVPLLDVPLWLAGLSSKVTTSCVSILAPFSTLSKCLDNSPEAKKSSANKSLNLSIRVKGTPYGR